MNYITVLRQRIAEMEAEEAERNKRFDEFRAHLSGSKFQGFDTDGERRDWIATGDTSRWISYVQTGV
jgi:hypothetical protein